MNGLHVFKSYCDVIDKQFPVEKVDGNNGCQINIFSFQTLILWIYLYKNREVRRGYIIRRMSKKFTEKMY